MPDFFLAEQVSEPQLGYTDNDDCAACVCTTDAVLAWVIDGATSVADTRYLDGASGDVAWYAQALSDALRARAAEPASPKTLHARAVADVTQQYEACVGARLADVPLHARPSASLVMVRLDAGGGQLYYLGDCPGFTVSTAGAVTRITDQQRTDGESDLRQRVADTQRRKALSPAAMFREHVPWLRSQRDQQLRLRPLEVSAALAGARFGGWERTFDWTGLSAIVLMSDGYERYAVQYGLGDESAMVLDTLAHGAWSVLVRTRQLEAGDATGRRIPRLKISDDATCLVLARPTAGSAPASQR